MPRGPSDSQCPLGFHPQVRFPNRCKRCFRDYSAHGDQKKTSLLDPHSTRSSVSASRFDEESYSRRSSYSRSSSVNLNDDLPPTPTETRSKDAAPVSPSLSEPASNESDRESRPAYKRSLTEIGPRSSSSQDSRSPRRLKIQSMREVRSIDEPDNQEVSFILKVQSTPDKEEKDDWLAGWSDSKSDVKDTPTNEQNEALKLKVRALEREINNLSNKYDDLEKDKLIIERKMAERSIEVVELKDTIEDLKKGKDDLVKKRRYEDDNKQGEIDKLKLRCQELEKEKDTISRRKRTNEEMKQTEIDKLRQKCEQLEKEKDEANRTKRQIEDSKKAEIDKLSSYCQELEKERSDTLRKRKKEEETKDKEIDDLKWKLEQTEKEKEELRKRKRHTDDSKYQELEELKDKNSILEKSLDEASRKRKQAESKMENDIKELKDELKKVEENLEDKTRQSNNLKSEIEDLKVRHQEEITDMKKESEGKIEFKKAKTQEKQANLEIKKLNEKCDELEKTNADLRHKMKMEDNKKTAEIESLKKKLEDVDKQKSSLESAKKETTSTQRVRKELEESRSRCDELSRHNEELKKELKQHERKSESDIESWKAKCVELQKDVEKMIDEKSNLSKAKDVEMAKLKDKCEEIGSTKAKLKSSGLTRSAEVDELKKRIQDLETEKESLKSEKDSIIANKNKELEEMKERIKSSDKEKTPKVKSSSEVAELKKEIKSLEEEKQKLSSKLESNVKKIEELEEVIKNNSEVIKSKDKNIQELESEKESLSYKPKTTGLGQGSEISSLKIKMKSLEKEKEDLVNKVKDNEGKIIQLEKEKEENIKKLKQKEKALKEIETEKMTQEKRCETSESKIKELGSLKSKYSDLEKKIEEVNKEHKNEVNKKQAELDKLKTKYETLDLEKTKLEKSHRELIEQSKKEVEKMREKYEVKEKLKSDIPRDHDNTNQWKEKYEAIKKDYEELDKRKRQNDETADTEITLLNQEIKQMKTKVSSLETANKDLFATNKSLDNKVNTLQRELENNNKEKETSSIVTRRRHSSEDCEKQDLRRQIEDLKGKLNAAETLCEELMDENEEFKKEIRDLEEEIEEMQDNFREDQADEYHSLKKELEQTAKNCRILQFKLRKAERRSYEIESDKLSFENKLSQLTPGESEALDTTERIRQLEQELNMAKEVSLKMHQEIELLKKQVRMFEGDKGSKRRLSGDSAVDSKTFSKREKDFLGDTIPVGRNIPGGEDTSNLLRDLQDTIEREQDTREQLKYAEEEAASLRKQLNRVEEENETLVLQLKKMANKKGKRFGRSSSLESDSSTSGDSGIVEEVEDCNPAELKLQLELHEQESSVLRRKVEELEAELERIQEELKDANERYSKLEKDKGKSLLKMTKVEGGKKDSIIMEQKLKIMDEETNELRKKLIEKEREVERLELEIQQSSKGRKGSKVILPRSRSLENDPQSVDLRRQLQLVEQEATILRTKTRQLEDENEKLVTENKKMSFRVSRKPPPTDLESAVMEKIEFEEKVKRLEKQLEEAESRAGLADYEASSGHVKDKSMGFYELEVLRTERDALQKTVQIRDEELLHLRMQLTETERQRTELEIRIDRAKLAANYKARSVRKTKETTTKQELKKLVDELELEIGELCVVIKNQTEENENLVKDIGFKNNEATDMKGELTKMQQICDDEVSSLSEKLERVTSDLQTEKNKVELFTREKKCLEEEVTKLEKESYNLRLDVEVVTERIEVLKSDLDKEKSEHQLTKERLSKAQAGDIEAGLSFDDLRKSEQEKHRLQKEFFDMESKLVELERKYKDSEDVCKCLDKDNKDLENQITALDCEITDVKSKIAALTDENKQLEKSLEKEREDMRREKAEAKKQLLKQENEYEEKIRVLTNQKASESIEEDKKVTNIKKKYEQEMKSLKEQQSTFKTKAADAENKLSKVEKELKNVEEKKKRMESELIKLKEEKQSTSSKLSDIELQLKTELKKKERSEKEYGNNIKSKEEEVTKLKNRVQKLETENKSLHDKINESFYSKKCKDLEETLIREKQLYNDLLRKYERLEEDYVGTKTKMVMEKEQVQGDYSTLKRDHDNLAQEIKSMKETFHYRQESWVKEKIELQERVKEQEATISRSSTKGAELERSRLQTIIKDRSSSIEDMKRVEDELRSEVSALTKQNEELRKKLHDFGRVQRFKERTNSVESNSRDDDVKELKDKFQSESRNLKAELTHLRIQHDSELAILKEETTGLQIQVGKYRRERDTFKQMLDGAQKTIADLKAGNIKKGIVSDNVELLAAKEKLNTMHQQMNTLEDKLADAKLDTVRAETDLATERATWQIKISELTTKINELEEFKLLSSGRTKLTGVKTKLELAWQKERDDQLKLINDTAITNRELRHQLVEIEKDRARERIDAKRDLERLQQTMEQEQEEVRRKVVELQRDLLDLRDSHARLRSINEKLRREKERLERDKVAYQEYADDVKRVNEEEAVKVKLLLDNVQKIVERNERDPILEAEDKSKKKKTKDSTSTMRDTIQSLSNQSQEIQSILKRRKDIQDSDKKLRQESTMPRSSSVEGDSRSTLGFDELPHSKKSHLLSPKRQFFTRKAVSMEQRAEQKKWKSQDLDSQGSSSSMGMLGGRSYSTESESGDMYGDRDRDPSLDRISTQSEIISSDKDKKKKTLKSRLKLLTKSKSIEDSHTAEYIASAGVQALAPGIGNSDIPKEHKEKKDLKDKLSRIFSKSKSSLRSQSVDRREMSEDVSDTGSLDRDNISENREKVPTALMSGIVKDRARMLKAKVPGDMDTSRTQIDSRRIFGFGRRSSTDRLKRGDSIESTESYDSTARPMIIRQDSCGSTSSRVMY